MANINGTINNDPALNGTGNPDTIDFSQGGNDVVSAGAGDDTLIAGGALTASDQVSGGADNDTLYLDGNYSGGITFGANTVTQVETIDIGSGNNYAIATHDNTVAAGQMMTIDAYSASAGKYVIVDGSAETNGGFYFNGGSSNDYFTGGAQYDNFGLSYGGTDIVHGGGGGDVFNLGGSLTTADLIDGGTGDDVLYLDGNYLLTLDASFVNSIETVGLLGNHNYTLTTADSFVAAGQNAYVSGWAISGSGHMTFNGAAESDGTFAFTDSVNNDVIAGGQNGDRFDTNMGGQDKFYGNSGEDMFFIGNAALDAFDVIDGGADDDWLALSGDYSAGLTLANSTIKNIETLTFDAGFDYDITLADGNVAAGATMSISGVYLTAGDTLEVDGSAETDGNFDFDGSTQNDIFRGGGGDDYMDMGQGGVDKIYGGGGDDAVQFRSTFTTADFVDGGSGVDHVYISGNYAGGLTLGSATIQNVEGITFADNFNYNVTALDSLVAAGATLAVDTYYLPADKSFHFDGSAETNGSFSLTGGNGNDTLIGGAQGDTFIYNVGSDTLIGNGGADKFWFSAGELTAADHIDGGAGTDTLILGGDFSQQFTFQAQMMKDVEKIDLYYDFDYNLKTTDGTVAAGQLLTVDGHFLGAGDVITFDGSAETNGRFQLLGGAAADVFKGGAGNDVFTGGGGNDTIDGGAGADTADYSDKSAAVVVTLNGSNNATVTVGGIAEDTIKNIERVFGGSGNDILTGDGAANMLYGSDGADRLKGGLGADTLDGGGSNDTADYRDKSAAVVVTLNGATNATVKVGGVSEDIIKNVENVWGGSAGDTLTGDGAANQFRGGGGNDTLDGGGGADLADYSDKSSAVVVTLNGATNATVTVGGVAEDTIKNIESVFGGSAGDTLTGDGAANVLYGSGGADTLKGGLGNDILSGGAAADTFVFNTAPNAVDNVDHVTDFASEDTIQLENFFFTGLTATGTLAADAFFSGAGATSAQDAEDRIVYDTNTGSLYYDADGIGGAAAVLFADLDNNAALTNADFFVV